MDEIKVLIDTKEKNRWSFAMNGFDIEQTSLKTGDYTIKGMENDLFIERKASTGEIAINLGKHIDRFERELKRAESFKHKFIICEFGMNEFFTFPYNSGIPKNKMSSVRINGKYLYSRLNQLCNKYGIQLILAGNRIAAEDACAKILIKAFYGGFDEEQEKEDEDCPW